ncbi:hypothetical protein EVJ58_g4569 [Rhodofomes roseus]|uniref:Uncharacterized protein n=1 Tax=Rhodofomes roseus TaxID=34475 RepID=A0A4Y9YIS1_9APHY|nr:hypothetical protein EVJ58_g4569 [Rhodofomes roseus]
MHEMRDRDKLDKLTGEYIEQAKLIREHAGLCHKWAQKEEHARTTKLERERFENVTSRLRKLGWGPEVDFLQGQEYNELAEHELVRVAKKLTDRVWQKIQSEVIQLMEDIRAERLEHEYTVMLTERWSVMKSVAKGLLDRYLSEHPEMLEYGLNIADLALTKEFREVMCAPEDEVVGSARFLALEGQMNTIVESWRSRIRKEVQELFVKHGIPTPRYGDPLDLVTTVFEDVRSSERSFFPRIVSHKALRSAKPEAGGDAYEEFVYGLDDVHCYETCSMLRPLPTNDAMREVIKLCGKDPDVASVQEMDALDLRLLDKYGRIRTWRGAVMASSDDNHHAYKLVDAEGTAKVKESEMCKLEQEKLWTCPKCETPQLPETRDVVLKHLSTEHGIELPDITDADLKINRALESSLLASWASGDCPPYKNFWARF